MSPVAPVADQPVIVAFDSPIVWPAAQPILARGGCVVLPTDTVYGIAAAADDPRGVAALQVAKGRSDDFPPPVLISQEAQAWALADQVPPAARLLAEAFWPGPLTLILATRRTDISLAGNLGSVGVRLPDHSALRSFLEFSGPLVTSSANRHGRPPATTVDQAVEQLGTAVDLYCDGGPTPGPGAATVVDCRHHRLVILREGLLSAEQIMTATGGADA